MGTTRAGCNGQVPVLCIKYGSSRTLNQLAGNSALHAQHMRMCLKTTKKSWDEVLVMLYHVMEVYMTYIR